MREFTRADYEIYAGAEPFRDGEEPMIYKMQSGMDLIADGTGVSLAGYVGTIAIFYRLYESRTSLKKSTECAAKEWIKELAYLDKRDQIALLHDIGVNCVTG